MSRIVFKERHFGDISINGWLWIRRLTNIPWDHVARDSLCVNVPLGMHLLLCLALSKLSISVSRVK